MKQKKYITPVSDVTIFYTESFMSGVWSGEHEIDLPEDDFFSSTPTGKSEP